MAAQIRDKYGNFVPKTRLNVVRHHTRNRKYLIPILLVAIMGGVYFVSRSFASSPGYSWKTCQPRYEDLCLADSIEANVATLYKGVLGRDADKSGMEFWANRVRSQGNRYSQVAAALIESPEGKKLYLTPDTKAFIATLHKTMYDRQPTSAEQKYWVDAIASKKYTRSEVAARMAIIGKFKLEQQSKVVSFIRSTYKVTALKGDYKVIAQYDLGTTNANMCPGKIKYDTVAARNVCTVASKTAAEGLYEKLFAIQGLNLQPGNYQIVYNVKDTGSSSEYSSGFGLGFIAASDGKLANTLPGAPGRGYSPQGAFSLYEGDKALGLPKSFSVLYDRPQNLQNGQAVAYHKDFSNLSLSKVEIRRWASPISRAYLMLSEVGYTGFSADPLKLTPSSSSNPPYTAMPDSPGKQCKMTPTNKLCTATVYNTVPAGTYDIYTDLLLTIDPEMKSRINPKVDITVTRTDTGKLVSKRVVTGNDPKITGVRRSWRLPARYYDIEDIYGIDNISTQYTVDTPANVKIEVSVSDANPPKPSDYRYYGTQPMTVTIDKLIHYQSRSGE